MGHVFHFSEDGSMIEAQEAGMRRDGDRTRAAAVAAGGDASESGASEMGSSVNSRPV